MTTTFNILETIFGQVNGNSIISLDTETIPTMRGGRANPHMGRVRKVSIGHNVMVFQNKHTNAYDAMVRRRLQHEGKNPERFVLGERSWGTRINGTPFVTHNDQMYLEVIFLRPGKVHYTLDGLFIEPEMINGLVMNHQEADQGGLEDKVVLRDFKFDSIRAVKIGGVEHLIR